MPPAEDEIPTAAQTLGSLDTAPSRSGAPDAAADPPSDKTETSVGSTMEAFLATITVENTHRAYRIALTLFVGRLNGGSTRPLSDVTDDEIGAALRALWGRAASSTWNARRAAVLTWLKWCAGQRLPAPTVPPTARRRKLPRTIVDP